MLLAPLYLACDLACEGSEKPGRHAHNVQRWSLPRCPGVHGQLAAAISTAVVHVFSDHTGRGPTKARTTLDGDLVVVILQEGMTKTERALVRAGKDTEVLQLRRTLQDTMSVDLIAAVERLTSRTVHAFMSANHLAPDTAAEIFLMDRAVDVAAV